MKLKSILKPKNVLSFIFIFQIMIYILFYTGILKSYKVEVISTSLRGYMFITSIYIMLFLINSIPPNKTKYEVITKKYKKIYIFIYLITILSIIGLLGITKDMINILTIEEIRAILFTNSTKDYLKYGGGYIPLITLSSVSIILLIIIWNNNKKNILLLFINIVVITTSGIILNSRIMIIQLFLYIAVILIRKKIYYTNIPIAKLIAVIFATILFLVVTSGVRDYNEEGKYYTDSKIKWGTRRVLDYPLTTINYSLELLNLDIVESDYTGVFELLNRVDSIDEKDSLKRLKYKEQVSVIRKEYGSLEYTNLGGIGQVYYYTGLFPSIIIFFIYSIIIAVVYRSYESGKVFGLMLYPIIFYSLLESWRLFSIGTEQILINFTMIIFIYMVTKDCFVHLPMESKLNDTQTRRKYENRH